MTWANNTFTNTLGATFVLSDVLESVIEDNHLTNSGAGIFLSTLSGYGGPAAYGPTMNTDLLRNTLTVGDGTDIWNNPNTNVSGIVIFDKTGCLLSGMMVRGNLVPSTGTISSSNGVNGVTAVVVEQSFALPVPGFLLQDDTPPPD